MPSSDHSSAAFAPMRLDDLVLAGLQGPVEVGRNDDVLRR